MCPVSRIDTGCRGRTVTVMCGSEAIGRVFPEYSKAVIVYRPEGKTDRKWPWESVTRVLTRFSPAVVVTATMILAFGIPCSWTGMSQEVGVALREPELPRRPMMGTPLWPKGDSLWLARSSTRTRSGWR